MYINDELILLLLHKTGGTHAIQLIDKVSPGKLVDKHERLTVEPEGRRILGTIRHPLDWYVSLWAYGCQKKGVLHWYLTADRHELALSLAKRVVKGPGARRHALANLRESIGAEPDEWRRLYADPDDPALFKAWLKRILSPRGRYVMAERYPHLPLRGTSGFCTFRFLYIYSQAEKWDRLAADLRTEEDIRAFADDALVVEDFIKTEQLQDRLSAILRETYGDVNLGDLAGRRTNRSKRRPAAYYHDDETRALVAERDWLIFERFGYDPAA